MTTDYKNTSLWRAAFAGTGLSQAQEESRNRLRTALARIEADIAELLVKIPESCKGLTVHDVRHVHQLWDVASTICGPAYPINPLEGFVLGAAFLIHDAGLT
ncbi:HD domain-containing protein, partial [Roseiarcus sp.]|uniref:HD domain-containing protein n=1 Tax=Roseiarcus sp. TaxID=1969460 RepID=UPI003D0CE463